jgi:hypothetical protein
LNFARLRGIAFAVSLASPATHVEESKDPLSVGLIALLDDITAIRAQSDEHSGITYWTRSKPEWLHTQRSLADLVLLAPR